MSYTPNPTPCPLIFMGTPEFAAIILEKLIREKWAPKAVIVQPDKPAGRKQSLLPPPTKQTALQYGIPILQPDKLKNNSELIQGVKNLKPDLIVVAAYGKIIPKEILDIPPYGCINVHPSLLPKYRGPSPIQAAILNGDRETGITLMLTDEEIDHGPVLLNSKFKILNPKVTYEELSEQLANLGAELLVETLPKYLNGEIKPMPQNEAGATYTKLISKGDGLIDWRKPAEEIERQIRAFHPWPGAFTKIQICGEPKILKIFKAEVCQNKTKEQSGRIFLIDKKMAVACGQNALILEEVQLEGKRRMLAEDFLRGYPRLVETIFEI